MIKNYLLLLALCFFCSANSQVINIPDANFKAKLLKSNVLISIAQDKRHSNIKIDLNGDGEIQLSEALNVYYLYVDDSNISSLIGIKSFSNLSILNCSSNKINSLDVSEMPNLAELSCMNNQMVNLNLSGSLNLSGLNCSDNQLVSLDLKENTKVEGLVCSNNPLKNLDITAYSSLLYLECSSTKLSNFDAKKFSNLITLTCESNELSSLDLKGMTNLRQLGCSNNKLSNLDLTDQINLEWLICFNNLFVNFDGKKMPKKLEVVNISDNPLEAVDLAGSNIKFIVIINTLVKSINFGTAISYFQISENPFLESLFIKNGSIENSNSLLYDNPNLKYICADEEEITQIKNKVSDAELECNSFCSFVSGGENYTITGHKRVDYNTNGCDALDIPANIKFNISDGIKNGSIIDVNEKYSIKVPAGNYTITPIIENPNYFSVFPSSFQVEFPNTTSPFIQDFCLTPVGIHPDLEITLIPVQAARTGFDTNYVIIYKNKGNTSQSGTVNLSFKDEVLNLVEANPVVSDQVLNNLSWIFNDLKPFESREISFVLKINSTMEIPAVNIGDILNYKASINSTETDEVPTDNIFELTQKVVGSYDPNDKTCLEGDVINPQLIGEYVHYMIRFENTGTYQAQNVVIKDIIDLSKFDINTLNPTSSSHSFSTKISDGNKVEFIFENINLPFDNASNDGYVAFKIKTLPTLKVGDKFENEANIYFDYNFPILTNKQSSTFTTLGSQDFTFSNYLNIYPNPAKDVLNILAKNAIEILSISIYNTLGQLVITIPDAKKTSSINVSGLATGNYVLKIKTDKGLSGIKFVKK